MHQCLGFLCLVSQGASLDSSARFPRHIHDNGHSDPACGAQMSRKNCDISGTCQPPSSCSRAYVTRLGANKSRSHVTRLLIGTLTIAFWSSSTQSTLVADTPLFNIGVTCLTLGNHIFMNCRFNSNSESTRLKILWYIHQ